jgi:parvulin-like peptidyl-prolyl isomerase
MEIMDSRTPVTPRAVAWFCGAPARWLGVVALLAGCGTDSGVLARVGGGTITRDEFLRAAAAEPNRFPGPPDSARSALLRGLVERELLLQGALLAGLDRGERFADYQRTLEQQMLRERMIRELADGPVAVSPAEVEEYYRWRAEEAHCRLIHTLSAEVARAALDELQRGVDFATVADHFNPPGELSPGGDLGFVTSGTLVGPLDLALRTAPIGRVIGPVEVKRQGWLLMRIEQRRPRAQPPLEAQRAGLAEHLRQRKQYEVLSRAIERMGVAYGVRVIPGGPQEVVGKLLPLAQAMSQQPGGPPLPSRLSPADRATVLAEYHGGTYTLGEAALDLENSQGVRPNLFVLPTVEWWIESQALERVLLLEARRRRLDQEPDFRRQVRDRADQYLLQSFVTDQVLGQVAIGDEDLRDAYRRRADVFVRLQEARLLTVTLPDSTAAARLIESAGAGGTLREVVATASLPVRVGSERVRYPTEQPVWRSLEPRLMRMSPGEYAGPLKTERGWMVAQLVSKEQGTPSYETVQAEIRPYLENEAGEAKRSQRMAVLTDSLRQAIPARMYPERLKYIPWPVTPPIPTSGS